ncbi:MAG: hypothetical protein WB421_13670, partial [Terriglobales bacterium]
MKCCERVTLDRVRLTKIFRKSIFVFDEIRSLLEYVMMSDTLKEIQGMIRSLLYFAVKEAKKVVFMDSSISIETLDFGISLRGSEGSVFTFNVADPPKKTVVFHETFKKPYVMAQIIMYLREGRNLFISSDSKKFVDVYADIIIDAVPNVHLLKYTSDTSDKERMGLSNPNMAWNTSTCVICSPTVTYGVDHTIESHFFAQYHFFHGHSQSPHGSFQQMGRTRFIESRVYVVMDLSGLDEDLVIDDIDTSIHKFNTAAVRRLNSEFERFDVANMGDMSDYYLANGTDEAQLEAIRVDEEGKCLIGELTYRLFLYAQSWKFCQLIRMECFLRDMCVYFGYEVLVDVNIDVGMGAESFHHLRMCQMAVKDLHRGSKPHPSGVSLLAMTPEQMETIHSPDLMEGVKTRVLCANATEEDNKILSMRTYIDGIGFKNLDGLEEKDLAIKLRMKGLFDPIYATRFEKVLHTSTYVYQEIIKGQNKSYFMKAIPDGACVEIVQVMISWFFGSPLVMRANKSKCFIPVEDMDKNCPILINLVLARLFQDRTLSHGFGITKSFRESNGPETQCTWTKAQACKIFQTCVKRFLNIGIY